jgi:hypothetical protein
VGTGAVDAECRCDVEVERFLALAVMGNAAIEPISRGALRSLTSERRDA